MSEWQPIETAPKDGSHIQVWPPTWTGVSSCARWETDKHSKNPRPFWSRTDDFGRVGTSRAIKTTHWKPISKGPKETP